MLFHLAGLEEARALGKEQGEEERAARGMACEEDAARVTCLPEVRDDVAEGITHVLDWLRVDCLRRQTIIGDDGEDAAEAKNAPQFLWIRSKGAFMLRSPEVKPPPIDVNEDGWLCDRGFGVIHVQLNKKDDQTSVFM